MEGCWPLGKLVEEPNGKLIKLQRTRRSFHKSKTQLIQFWSESSGQKTVSVI